MSVFREIVYRSPGAHSGPPGKTYDYLGVFSQAEIDAALAAGWCRTLVDACTDKAAAIDPPLVEAVEDPAPADDAPPTREELRAKAAEIGLEYDGRISDKKLLMMINDALKR